VTGNLLAPVIVHAIYDFAVLLYLQRRQSRRRTAARLTER
jgi:membrane protease YdiL (CAAX protease family)